MNSERRANARALPATMSAESRARLLARREGGAPMCSMCERLEGRVLLHSMWDGGGDGLSWSDPANWSEDRLPGVRDDVVIGRGFGSVMIDRSVRVRSLLTEGDVELRGGTVSAQLDARLLGRVAAIGHSVVMARRAIEVAGVVAARGADIAFVGGAFLLTGSAAVEAGAFAVRAAGGVAIHGKVRAPVIVVQSTGSDELGTVIVTGVLDASARRTGGAGRGLGGSVQVLGDRVVLDGARVNASGPAGGGRVNIGGDYLGGGDLARSSLTRITDTAVIRADAGVNGNGGRVIVWADEATWFDGLIAARGGKRGGDGGFVETSGKVDLHIGKGLALAHASASGQGVAGSWLLDPRTITIGPSNLNTNFSGTDPRTYFATGGSPAVVSAASISTALNSGTSVIVTTSFPALDSNTDPGDITVAVGISKTGGAPCTLTLNAANDIIINAPITNSSASLLNLVLNANDSAQWGEEGPGTWEFEGDVQVNSAITTNGGVLDVSGVNIVIGAAVNTASGSGMTGAVSLNASFVALTGAGSINARAGVVIDGLLGASISGDITSETSVIIRSHVDPFVFGDPTTSGVSLGSGVDVAAPSITLSTRSYTNDPAVTINAAAVFRGAAGGATRPDVFVLAQDAALPDASIPAAANFGASVAGMTYALTAAGGGVLATASKVAGTQLTLNGPWTIGTSIAPASIATSPQTMTIGADISTAAGQSFGGPVVLSSNAVLTGTSVTFASSVNGTSAGGQSLTVNTTGSGVTTFVGAVGGSVPLSSLTTNADGSTFVGNVTVSGAVLFNNPVRINQSSATITSTGGGGVTFAASLDSEASAARNLLVATSGVTAFNGQVGSLRALASLTTNAGGSTSLSAPVVTVEGAVQFGDAVSLLAPVTLAGGSVQFASTLNSPGVPRSLTVNSAGATVFAGAVGGVAPIGDLTTDASGSLIADAPITSSGSLAFNETDALFTNGPLVAGGPVFFGGLSFAQGDLNITSPDGPIFGSVVTGFGGALSLRPASVSASIRVGGSAPTADYDFLAEDLERVRNGFSSFSIGRTDGTAVLIVEGWDAPQALLRLRMGGPGGSVQVEGLVRSAVTEFQGSAMVTTLNAGILTTADSVTFEGPVFIGAIGVTVDATNGGTHPEGAAITFQSTLDSEPGEFNPLTLYSGSSDTFFQGSVGQSRALSALTILGTGAGTVVLTGPVSTTGAQTYDHNAVIAGSFTLTAGSLFFERVVNADSAPAARVLTLAVSGLSLLRQSVGASVPLGSLISGAAGTVRIGGDVVTTGNQFYGGAVELNNNPVLTGNNITFSGPLNDAGSPSRLTVNTTGGGTTTFAGGVGTVTPPMSLTTNSDGQTLLGQIISTTEDQTFNDAVTFTVSDAPVTVSGRNITFNGPLSANNIQLAVNTAGGGVTTFAGGASSANLGITTNADGATRFTGVVSLGIGDLNVNNAVVLLGDTQLSARLIGLNGTIDSDGTPRALALSGDDNPLINSLGLGGSVGATSPLASFTLSAGNLVAGGGSSMTATGSLTFNRRVGLFFDYTFTGSSVTFLGEIKPEVGGIDIIINSVGGGVTTITGGVATISFEPMASLTTNADGTLVIGGTVRVGTLTMNDETVLGADLTVIGSTVVFGNELNSIGAGRSLRVTLSPGGVATLSRVGNTLPLASIEVDGDGITVLAPAGGQVVTTGNQAFGNTVLATTAILQANNVSFLGTVNSNVPGGDVDLTINSTGSGVTTIGGVVGGLVPLSDFTTNADGTIIINAGITATGTITIGEHATLGAGAALSAPSGVIFLAGITFLGDAIYRGSDPPTFSGPITGAGGAITFEPNTASANVRVGGAVGTGDYDLLLSTIAQLEGGFGSINIGRHDGTGQMTILATTWNDPVWFRMWGPGGGIRVIGELTGTDDASFTFSGSGATTVIEANITTAGQAVVFDDAVLIGSAMIEIRTTGEGAGGGEIRFMQTLDSETGEGNSLMLTSGAGDTKFEGEVGGAASGELGMLATDGGSGLTEILGGLIRTLSTQQFGGGVKIDGLSAALESAFGEILLSAGLDAATSGLDVLLRALEVDFFGDVQGSSDGSLRIEQSDLLLDIFIAAATGGSGRLDLTSGEIANIINGWGSVTIGASGGSGSMSIEEVTWVDPVTFVMNGLGGSIVVNGRVTGADDGTITLDGSSTTTELNASIVTHGNAIRILDAVRLGVNVVLDTTDGGASAAGADIIIEDSVYSQASEANGLSLLSGSAGDITLSGPIGTAPGGQLGSLTIDPGGATTISSGTIRTSGPQTFGNAVRLAAPLVVQTTGGAPVSFTAAVDGQQNLTIATGTGPVVFSAPVGGTTSLAALTINAGSTRVFEGAADIGVLTVFGGTVAFNGPTTAQSGIIISGILTGTGDITFTLPLSWVGGAMLGQGRTIIAPTGALVISGINKTLGRTIENNGQAYWVDSQINFAGGRFLNNAGASLFIQAMGSAVGSGPGTNEIVNNGFIQRDAPGVTQLSNVEFINNAGAMLSLVQGDLHITPAGGTFNNAGTISIGAGSTLWVSGAFEQSATGRLDVQIGGPAPGVQHGRLAATGAVALDGEIGVTLFNGFVPALGDQFAVIVGESVAGTFESASLPPPVGSAQFRVLYNPATVVITLTSGADFNGSGDVTVQDIYDFLAAWNSGLPIADFNGQGGVTVQDIYDFLAAWNAG